MKVPDLNIPLPKQQPTTAFYCFPRGTSEADKQHDIVEVDKFIKHVRAKRARRKSA